ncbi:MAG: SDR family oxidoreductase [Flavobacterium sp.]|nr:SDR family oxidoreductase [Flavobacterium sp.]
MQHQNAFQLTGKNIVITGASSGIGRQCAITCGSMGARVLLIGRNKDKLAETLEMMNKSAAHQICATDLTDFEATADVLKDLNTTFGKIHGIVHCAGISTALPLRSITPAKLEQYFLTNVHAGIQLSKNLTKPAFLTEEGASIIFLTSVMGVVGEVGKTIYSLTKGALVAGSKSMALELAPKKVRVNCISPGVVVTPMSSNAVYSQDEEALERVTSYHPLGLGKPEDIANTAVFLLSDASRWITGTNIIVDGGYTAK